MTLVVRFLLIIRPGGAMAGHFAMHEEHAQWEAERHGWEAEAARWEDGHKGVVEKLAEIESRLRREARDHEYREAIRAGAAATDRHEQEIARHERGGRGEEHGAMAEEHRLAGRRHDEARQEHHRKSVRRREIAELVDRLHGLLGPPEPPR